MKKCLLIGLCLAPLGAYATGGFECKTVDKSIEILGTTAARVGNPLISVTVLNNGRETVYSKAQAVAYWNLSQKELKLALADDKYTQIDYELQVQTSEYDNGPFSYGSLRVAEGPFTYDINCRF